MASHLAERVAQDIRAQARPAHAEQDHVGELSCLLRDLLQLAGLFEHLVGDVEPAEPVVYLLALGRIGAPQRRVLRPQPARSVLLLESVQLRIYSRLQAAEAVPLAR